MNLLYNSNILGSVSQKRSQPFLKNLNLKSGATLVQPQVQNEDNPLVTETEDLRTQTIQINTKSSYSINGMRAHTNYMQKRRRDIQMLTPNTSNRQGGPFIYSNEGSQISDKNSLPNFSIIGSQKMLKVSSKFSHKKFSNKGSNSPKKSRYVSKSFSKLFILGNLTRGLISALVFHG